MLQEHSPMNQRIKSPAFRNASSSEYLDRGRGEINRLGTLQTTLFSRIDFKKSPDCLQLVRDDGICVCQGLIPEVLPNVTPGRFLQSRSHRVALVHGQFPDVPVAVSTDKKLPLRSFIIAQAQPPAVMTRSTPLSRYHISEILFQSKCATARGSVPGMRAVASLT